MPDRLEQKIDRITEMLAEVRVDVGQLKVRAAAEDANSRSTVDRLTGIEGRLDGIEKREANRDGKEAERDRARDQKVKAAVAGGGTGIASALYALWQYLGGGS